MSIDLDSFDENEGDDPRLVLRLDHTRPVELTDLGRSLEALGTQYQEFVVRNGVDSIPANAKLFVSRVSSGSIIIQLQTMLDQASFLVKHFDVLAGFVANLQDIITYLLKLDKASASDALARDEVQRMSDILEPVASNSGSQLTINVSRNSGPVIVAPIVITSEKANAIQNAARRYLGPKIPDQWRFQGELLYLHQVRGDSKATVGDRGVIEKFSKKPVKLRFMSPAVKAEITEKPENPFKLAYIVDGEVSTVRGEPALYKIDSVQESIERP